MLKIHRFWGSALLKRVLLSLAVLVVTPDKRLGVR
jgi:hypothetical protein